MRVLGLDMSTCSGVAIVDSAEGVMYAADVKAPSSHKDMQRVNSILTPIMELRAEYAPDAILMEDYFVSKFGGASIVSIEIGAILRFCLWQEETVWGTATASVLKKFVTGSGKAKKDQMVLEVFKRFGYSSKSNDIADAVGLGYLGLAMLGHPYPKLTRPQLDAAKSAFDSNPMFRCN